MKNSLKIGALALVIAASFSACDPAKPAGDTETAKIDTLAKKDSLKKDSLKVDSAKKDAGKKM